MSNRLLGVDCGGPLQAAIYLPYPLISLLLVSNKYLPIVPSQHHLHNYNQSTLRNHRPLKTRHSQTVSHNVVLITPRRVGIKFTSLVVHTPCCVGIKLTILKLITPHNVGIQLTILVVITPRHVGIKLTTLKLITPHIVGIQLTILVVITPRHVGTKLTTLLVITPRCVGIKLTNLVVITPVNSVPITTEVVSLNPLIARCTRDQL